MKALISFLIVLQFKFLKKVFAGFLFKIGSLLIPATIPPVSSTIANAGEYSDYTFNFITQTNVPAGGNIIIVFPYQFISTLGINIIDSSTCTLACSIANNTVILNVTNNITAGSSIFFHSVTSILIRHVLNPTFKGGVGNFKVSTKIGIKTLDENLIFSIFGISDFPGNLSQVNIQFKSGNSSFAGDNTTIQFSFKSARNYIPNDYISFQLPSSLTILNPINCGFLQVNNYVPTGNYTCVKNGQEIIVSGFNTSIPAQTELSFFLDVSLPMLSGDVGAFVVSFFRASTRVVYDWRRDITGLVVTAGNLVNVTIQPLVSSTLMSKGKVMDYNISFTTKNPIPQGGTIQINFPNSVQIPSNTPLDFILIGKGFKH